MSAAPLEIEVKLLVPHAADLAAIGQLDHVGVYRLQPRRRARLHSVYLDTPERALARNGLVLRLRRDGRRWEATIKWRGEVNGTVHARPELTVALLGPPATPFVLPAGPLCVWLSAVVARRPLAPVLITDIARQVADVLPAAAADDDHPEPLAELALDQVRIVAPGERRARATYDEVEIELRRGTPDDLTAFAEELRARFDLPPSPESKFARGLAVLYGPDAPRPFTPGLPTADATVADAVGQIVALQLSRLRQHDPGTRLGEDPEALHNMRVAVRRLRAAVRIFDTAIPRRQRESLQRELGWLGQCLGRVRDLDVQLLTLDTYRAALAADQRDALAWLETHLRSERTERRTEMLAGLESRRYYRLLLRLERFAAAPRRRKRTSAAAALLAATGRRALARAATRLLRRGRAIAEREGEPTAADLHALRIRAKRVRYLLEFLRELTGKPGQRVVKRLVRLQDLLGAHQDAVVAADCIRGAAAAAGAQLSPDSLLALGAFIEHERQRAAQARAEFRRVWRRFGRKQTPKDVRTLVRRLRDQSKRPVEPSAIGGDDSAHVDRAPPGADTGQA